MKDKPVISNVVIWLPRADEYSLAASLGMVQPDMNEQENLITQAQEQIARDMPGSRVIVHRWHIWRVVRMMVRAMVSNTPDGRATAYTLLSTESDEE